MSTPSESSGVGDRGVGTPIVGVPSGERQFPLVGPTVGLPGEAHPLSIRLSHGGPVYQGKAIETSPPWAFLTVLTYHGPALYVHPTEGEPGEADPWGGV